jgi:hypothetical protein
MPQTPIETLLVPFPLINEWFAQFHEDPHRPPRTKAAALLMLHHGRQKGQSAYSLDAISKAVGFTAAALSVRKQEYNFMGEMDEEAESFGTWALIHRAGRRRALRSYVEELKRTIDHLAPYAAKAFYRSMCSMYDVIVEEYRDDGHADDVVLLPEIGARCVSRAYGLPMSDILVDAVATILARPGEDRQSDWPELQTALRQQTQSTAALRAEIRQLREEVGRLRRLLGEGGGERRAPP